jgi:GDP-L-fucose synthase
MNKLSKIFIAGHRGMVGSAITRKLTELGYTNLVLRTSKELDLIRQSEVEEFFRTERPEYVFLAAAKVGGIHANNTYRADFIYNNLMIESNIINSSWKFGVKKLLFLGSSCIYPKLAKQPLKEKYLLSDYLEKTNEPYAIAKISGIKLCESYNIQYGTNFISGMPTNLYGPFDNFDLNTSHVLPAMIRKFHEAKMNNNIPVILWGTGTPMREFLFVDDLAKAVIFAIENALPESRYNIGSGIDLTIKELAETIQEIVGHKGEIKWDTSKPDGTPKKLMDITKMHQLGWHHQIELRQGIQQTYDWYLNHLENYKQVKIT